MAFDYSEKMVELAKKRQKRYADHIEFCVADATNETSLMAGHIKETFILLFTMAGACLIVFLVPGLFVLFPGILCGIASHLIEPGLKKALAID